MLKYFSYPRSDNWVNCPYPHQAEKEVNEYCEKNNLEIVSISCDRDMGLFVVFKEKS